MGSEWLTKMGFMGVYANGRAVLLKITRIWGFDFLHSYHFRRSSPTGSRHIVQGDASVGPNPSFSTIFAGMSQLAVEAGLDPVCWGFEPLYQHHKHMV